MAFKLGRPILGHRLVCPELYALLLRRVQLLPPSFKKAAAEMEGKSRPSPCTLEDRASVMDEWKQVEAHVALLHMLHVEAHVGAQNYNLCNFNSWLLSGHGMHLM